jgi:hypothetical protein
MLKNRQKQVEINSDVLYQISIKLLDIYDIEPNIYYMLLLSYLTVKEFSKNNEHLDKNAKIELCVQFTPDLIIGLTQAKIINFVNGTEMKEKFLNNENDMKLILEVYYVIFNFKNDKLSTKSKSCCIK